MISMNVILLGSIATQLLYAQPDNNQLTVHKLIASFPFIPMITSPNQTMGRSVPAISNVSQSSTNQMPSNGNSTFLIYKNPIYGIQMQYPSTWIKVANQGHEIVRFISPPGRAHASLGIIVRTDASQLIPLQVYVNAGIDVLKKIFSGFNLISSNVTTLGGVPAQKMVYTADMSSGLKLKFLQYFAIRDNTSYVITSGTLPGDFATYLPTLQRMISSLSFISPTSLSTPNGTVATSNQTALRNATNSISSLQKVPKSVPFSSSNNTYTNSTDGIYFNIPQRWTTEEGYNQANATLLTVVTVSPPIALDPSALMQVIIEKDTNPLTSSIDQYLRDQLNSYRNNPSNNFKLISANTNTTLSGQPAYSLLFTYTPHVSYAGPLSEHSEVGTLLNGQAYIIDYYGSKDLFSKFLPQVKQIVKSFKINRPAEQPAQQKQSRAATTSSVTTLADKGNALFNHDNYAQALQYFNKALAIDPNNEVALTGKGYVLNSLGNYSQAIPYLDKVIAMDPNNKDALTGKGDSLNGLGNYTQAIPYLDKALAIDPNIKVALNAKGVALYGLGNYTQAIQWFDKAIAIDPNYKQPLYNKGASLNAVGNYTEAIPYLDKALAIDPNYQEALASKGDSLDNLRNYSQAMPYLDKALAIDPNDKVALNDKGYALSGLGNYTQAIRYYDKALAIDPNYKIALDNKRATLSKMSQQQQQNINESRLGPAPSPSPYAAFNSSGLVCHYKSQSRNLYCAMRR
jgi:tetratricopeptide (TPR) repeat protein